MNLSGVYQRVLGSIKNSFPQWLGASAIATLLIIPSIFIIPIEEGVTTFNLDLPNSLSGLFAAILQILVLPGLIAMGLAGSIGKKAELSLIIKKANLALKIFGFSILYGAMLFLGFLALIIPGIYLAVRYGFAAYLLIEDENIGVFDAMSKASKMVEGKYMKILFSGAVVVFAVNIIYLLFSVPLSFFIGSDTHILLLARNILLIPIAALTMPINYVGLATIYQQVKEEKNGS